MSVSHVIRSSLINTSTGQGNVSICTNVRLYSRLWLFFLFFTSKINCFFSGPYRLSLSAICSLSNLIVVSLRLVQAVFHWNAYLTVPAEENILVRTSLYKKGLSLSRHTHALRTIFIVSVALFDLFMFWVFVCLFVLFCCCFNTFKIYIMCAQGPRTDRIKINWKESYTKWLAGHAHLHTLGKAKETGNRGEPNTSPEQMEISTPRLNIMQKSATTYIHVTPKFLKQV